MDLSLVSPALSPQSTSNWEVLLGREWAGVLRSKVTTVVLCLLCEVPLQITCCLSPSHYLFSHRTKSDRIMAEWSDIYKCPFCQRMNESYVWKHPGMTFHKAIKSLGRNWKENSEVSCTPIQSVSCNHNKNIWVLALGFSSFSPWVAGLLCIWAAVGQYIRMEVCDGRSCLGLWKTGSERERRRATDSVSPHNTYPLVT